MKRTTFFFRNWKNSFFEPVFFTLFLNSSEYSRQSLTFLDEINANLSRKQMISKNR